MSDASDGEAVGEAEPAASGGDETSITGDASDEVAKDREDGSAGGSIGLLEARTRALSVAGELLDGDPDRVIRVERTDRGWRTLVEVVERAAVPNTQDLLGRYELVVDDGGSVVEYGLTERYRRGESREEL